MHKLLFYNLLILASFFIACTDTTADSEKSSETADIAMTPKTLKEKHNFPDWARNASLYEVNLRQYTPQGTIKAFMTHLERIKEMGVDILWFMPIHPISKAKRKGSLGSPYAIADYRAINPELGTMEDFEQMLQKAHTIGLKVIIDWVPNHSGWDHPWITEHPDYYSQVDGKIIDPIDPETGESWGWTDVADFNYDNSAFRKAMIADMEFWIKEVGIDGFRCDVAHQVPDDFWDQAAEVLFQYRPIFMLAESESPAHNNSGNFIATYSWSFKDLANGIVSGEKTVADIDEYLKKDRIDFKKGFHIYFTTNHDENTSHGTVFERLGDGHRAFAVLAATLDGMPLIYGGQEAPLKKRLAFFEKDPIDWNNYAYADFYKILLDLKHRNKALWNGKYGGEVIRIPTGKDAQIFAFVRQKEEDKVLVIINLSPEAQEFKLDSDDAVGHYSNVFVSGSIDIEKEKDMRLEAWDYLVLSTK